MLEAIQQVSWIDYPGILSTVAFFQGCQLRCPYCHNPQLTTAYDPQNSKITVVEFESILKGVRKDRGPRSLVLTGGEPTTHPMIFEAAAIAKSLGFRVKLDTNGLKPLVVEQMIERDLLDYVALDFKDIPSGYIELGAQKADVGSVLATCDILERHRKVEYELRTTITQVHTDDRIRMMRECISKSHRFTCWYFQPARQKGSHQLETLHLAYRARELMREFGIESRVRD
jgi:pyruvate formate lyase activating enzyme